MDKKERDRVFNENYETLKECLKNRKHRWKLSSLAYMDYNDVSQLLTEHLYNKLHLYDEKQPFLRWCQKLITNRMMNLVRDNYGNFAPPCKGCPYNEEDKMCSHTASGYKDSGCKAFAKWSKNKKDGYNLKLALSMNHPDYIELRENSLSSESDEVTEEKLIEAMRESLDGLQLTIFEKIFIDKMKDAQFHEEYGETLSSIKKNKALIVKKAKGVLGVNV